MDLNCRSACSAVLSRSMGRLAEFHQRLSPSVHIWTWCQRRKNFSQAALDFVVLNAQRLRYLEVISLKNNFGIPNALSRLRRGRIQLIRRNGMLRYKNAAPKTIKLTLGSLLIAGLLVVGSTPGLCATKSETIEASAMGTSTQMGSQFSITLNIYDYSTQADKQILVEAFQKGKDQGLVNALSKMKAAGHIEVTGTLGYDCSYIQVIPTPTGRKIRFVTNRLLRFGEVYWDTRSTT